MFTSSQLAIINYLLVYQPTSRKRLAKTFSLSTAAVTNIVNQLMEQGLIYELKELDLGKVGRKETLIDVVEEAYYAIGLDVENHRVRYSLTSLKGKLIDTRTFVEIDEAIEHIRDLSTRKKNLLGITMMLRGYVNESTYYHSDKKIKSKLETLELPFLIINNVSALAIMHRFYNYDDQNFLLIKYGPGIGSSIMVNGGLVGQKSDAHSEIGQMILDLDRNKRLESCIRYESIDPDVNDETIITYLKKMPDKYNYLINCVGVSIVNSNVLLSLDKVVIAGVLFTDDEVFEALISKIKTVSDTLSEENIVRIDDYSEKTRKLGSIVTIYAYFNGMM